MADQELCSGDITKDDPEYGGFPHRWVLGECRGCGRHALEEIAEGFPEKMTWCRSFDLKVDSCLSEGQRNEVENQIDPKKS